MAPIDFADSVAHLAHTLTRRNKWDRKQNKWSPRAIGGLVTGIVAIVLLFCVFFICFNSRRPNNRVSTWFRGKRQARYDEKRATKREKEQKERSERRQERRDLSSTPVPDEHNAAVQAGLKPGLKPPTSAYTKGDSDGSGWLS